LPQEVLNAEAAAANLQEALLVLSCIANYRLFTYSNDQAWFVPIHLGQTSTEVRLPEWGQNSYWVAELTPADVETLMRQSREIELVEPRRYYNRYGRRAEAVFDLPRSVTELLDSYFTLPKKSRKGFLSACSLLAQALQLWGRHPSLAFAATISAIETVISIKRGGMHYEKCPKCGQLEYKVSRRFKDFLAKYASPAPEFRKYASLLYKYRSKILHKGELFLGEIEPRRFALFEGIEDDELRRDALRTARIALVNWLISPEI
jgi:hypothetical protein